MIDLSEKRCPRCGSNRMKDWAELNDDEKLLAKSLPMSAEHPLMTRKKHRFCTICWFETADVPIIT